MSTLRFHTLSVALAILLRLFFSDHCLAAPEAVNTNQERPNIVFIWIDTLRADSLGCYGYERDTSPHIDQLAKESTLFFNNFTPHTVTLSSFMSIITGLYPFSHGVLHIAKDFLSPKVKTLAEILKMNGYTTFWYGPNGDPHLDPAVGFGRGFDVLGVFDNNLSVGRAKILRVIEQHKNENFFINFHSYFVHAPYIPSAQYKYRFTKQKSVGLTESYEELEKATVEVIKKGVFNQEKFAYTILGAELSQEMATANLFDPDYEIATRKVKSFLQRKNEVHKYDNIFSQVYELGIKPRDKENITYAKSLYDAGILEFDTEIVGPVINKLKELGLYENTMIIICADHGEEFGEHGGSGHGRSLYEEVTRVPLIIKTTGKTKAKIIRELSQTVDILPTILGLLHIDPPYNSQGVNFAPLINETGPLVSRKYIYGQMPYYSSIRTDTWKMHIFKGYQSFPLLPVSLKTLIFGRKELFNLQKDPGETNNLYYRQNDIRDELSMQFEEWEQGLKDYQDKNYYFKPNIDERTKAKIKKTGYW
ncbi:MAG: sulfatase-like hydrolase/transferase [Proteobacteria bacterium]|nr:sulfatase-like hydrolase/transferase [Pseudomonadota bacterium]